MMLIKYSTYISLILLIVGINSACVKKATETTDTNLNHNEAEVISVTHQNDNIETISKKIVLGAERTDAYLSLLEGKKVAMIVNHTSFIHEIHLVDSLIKIGIDIQKIFAPEHGFRGQADAGASVKDGKDSKTGLPIVSLYGKNKKPRPDQLEGIDIVLFDIQDVGARFYTYISTMHYVMEACAEFNIPFIVLDRPNPNGHYVDGPMLEDKYRSFVGMHDIPVVHGLTVAELARMINGEGWLKDGIQCNLVFVECKNYSHDRVYELPIKPSPNLPNARSIALYPSLCFFEGTTANVGRGTDKQFQVMGHPKYPNQSFSYVPTSRSGAKYPKFQDKTCYGVDLSQLELEEIRNEKRLNLSYLIDYYYQMPNQKEFFLANNFLDKLAGTDQLRKDIIAGKTEDEIRERWESDLEAYKIMREKYLLYYTED